MTRTVTYRLYAVPARADDTSPPVDWKPYGAFPTKQGAVECAHGRLRVDPELDLRIVLAEEKPVNIPPLVDAERMSVEWEMGYLKQEFNGLEKLATRQERMLREANKMLAQAQDAGRDPKVQSAIDRRAWIAVRLAQLELEWRRVDDDA